MKIVHFPLLVLKGTAFAAGNMFTPVWGRDKHVNGGHQPGLRAFPNQISQPQLRVEPCWVEGFDLQHVRCACSGCHFQTGFIV